MALSSCGGGSSNGGNTGSGTPTTAEVQGIWTGSYTITGVSGSIAVDAEIEQGGYGFFFDANGYLFVLPKLTGATTFTGAVIGYAPSGETFSDGKTVESFNLTGTASNKSISGDFSGSGVTGTFTLTPLTAFTGTPSLVAGNWQGYYVGSGSSSVAITVGTNGQFTGNDGNGCTLTGQIAQVTKGSNLFTVTADSSGSVDCVGRVSGLAFESNSDFSGAFSGAAGTYYYVGASNSNSAYAAELMVQ